MKPYNTFLTRTSTKVEEKERFNIKNKIKEFEHSCIDMIDSLEGPSIANVLAKQENEFVNAYRNHMLKVKNEIEFLKNKADEQKAKVMQDSRVKQLKNSIRWFKNESSKLAQTYDFQKKEIEMVKSKKLGIVDDNKFLKDQAKGCMRQNKILKHALNKNRDLLEKLKAMSDGELRVELLKGEYQNEFVLDPSKLTNPDEENTAMNIEDAYEESKDEINTSFIPKPVNDYRDEELREIAYEDMEDNEESDENIDISNNQLYRNAKDYVSYGLDYIGSQADPNKVEVNQPVIDYVFQLLCNPKCTNEIFKTKMLEYQYYKDRPMELEISKIK